MTIEVDLWTTAMRGDVVQQPLAKALMADGRVNQRLVFCEQSLGKESMQELCVQSCSTAGTKNVREVPFLIPRIFSTRSKLRDFYRNSNSSQIVHVTMASIWDQFYLDIAKNSGAKILLVVHDAQRHIGEESRWAERLESRLISMADHLAVLSRYAGGVLKERVGNKKPIHIVSPGLVMNADPPGPAKGAPRNRPIRFLFFGRIHAYKGLDILLNAWARYQNTPNAPPATLSIVGSGNIEPYRRAIVNAKNVTLKHGWISDEEMAYTFDNHDVNVLPYLEGSTSATSLAGMWAGMPTIATRIDGFADQLFDGVNALLCDIDSGELCNSMLNLAANPNLFELLANGAKQEAIKLSAPAVAENWISLYRNILEN
jgi:glycosyltransferase involved in cell wall biosynthesis